LRDPVCDPIGLCRRNEWADFGLGKQGISDAQSPDTVGEPFDEGVLDCIVDVDALDGDADLTRMIRMAS